MPYKKVDLAVEAFNQLNYPLVVVGIGNEESKLKSLSRNNIRFVGKVSDNELAKYYKNCKALIFPQEEDFGLVAVEAQFYGKPVIAYNAGGALDIVINGKTGVFFNEQNWQALYDAVKRFEKMSFDSKIIVHNAQRFSKQNFWKKFKEVI
ncbi:MAG: glycosyltransferase [Patescibacteria group bacterium]